MPHPMVAALRPDDDRIVEAVQYLRSLGAAPVADPMLTVQPTGTIPKRADYCIFTSKTGVEITLNQDWRPKEAMVCAIGQQTAAALRERDIRVDIVPSTYSSAGLLEELASDVDGNTVELARSAHGSDTLTRGLHEAGAIVHETHLYRLERPNTAGYSVALAVESQLDGILFTSPKTVDHFVEIATDRYGLRPLQWGIANTIVGAIGTPTEEALCTHGIPVDVKPDTIGFTHLARRTLDRIESA